MICFWIWTHQISYEIILTLSIFSAWCNLKLWQFAVVERAVSSCKREMMMICRYNIDTCHELKNSPQVISSIYMWSDDARAPAPAVDKDVTAFWQWNIHPELSAQQNYEHRAPLSYTSMGVRCCSDVIQPPPSLISGSQWLHVRPANGISTSDGNFAKTCEVIAWLLPEWRICLSYFFR